MKKDTLFGIVALIWFLASFVGLFVVTGMGKEWLVPAIMGQIFLVFGTGFIISRISSGNFGYTDIFLFLFPLVGTGCIVGSFIFHYGSREMVSVCVRYLPYAFLGVFLIYGVFLIGKWYRNTAFVVERCSQRIEAKCIDFRTHYKKIDNRRVLTFCPIYQFYYNGNTYEVCNNVYSNLVDFNVDEIYEIYINPNKPEQFYQPTENKVSGIIHLIMGLVFTIFPIVVMVLYSRVI